MYRVIKALRQTVYFSVSDQYISVPEPLAVTRNLHARTACFPWLAPPCDNADPCETADPRVRPHPYDSVALFSEPCMVPFYFYKPPALSSGTNCFTVTLPPWGRLFPRSRVYCSRVHWWVHACIPSPPPPCLPFTLTSPRHRTRKWPARSRNMRPSAKSRPSSCGPRLHRRSTSAASYKRTCCRSESGEDVTSSAAWY